MTVALNIKSGEEIAAGNRSEWGAGPGPSQAAAVLFGKGQDAGWLSEARGNSRAAFSGDMGFSSNWQAMLRASGAGLRGTGEAAGETGEIRAAGADEEAHNRTDSPAKSLLANAVLPARSIMLAGQSALPVVATNMQALIRLQSVVADLSAPAASAAEIAKDGDSGPASVRGSQASPDAGPGRCGRKDRQESDPLQTGLVGQGMAAESTPIETASLLAAGQSAPGTVLQAQRLGTVAPEVDPIDLDDLTLRSSVVLRTTATALNGPLNLAGGKATNAAGPASAVQSVAHERPAPRTMATATPSETHYQSTSGTSIPEPDQAETGSTNQRARLQNAAGTPNEEPKMNLPAGRYRAGSGSAVVEGTNTPAIGSTTLRGAAASLPVSAQLTNVAADAERSGLDGSKAALESTDKPPAHAAGAAGKSATAAHTMTSQQVGISADTSALVRVPAGAHGALSTMPSGAHALAGSSTGALDGMPPQATFSALDAGSGVKMPNWVHAGARQAEAGFEDPALGWVGVRADVNGSGVHASLVPETGEAAQVLSAHMAGLSAYLTEQHTPVTTLTLEDSSGTGVGTGADQQLQQGPGQNAEGSRSPEVQPSLQPEVRATMSPTAQATAISSGGFNATAHIGAMRGTHISVMA